MCGGGFVIGFFVATQSLCTMEEASVCLDGRRIISSDEMRALGRALPITLVEELEYHIRCHGFG